MYIILYLLSCTEDCFSLGGGYGDADVSALRQECNEDGGKNCDGDFMGQDAALCFAVEAEHIELDSRYSWDLYMAYSDFHNYYNRVVWVFSYRVKGNAFGWETTLYLDAVDGTALARTSW